MERKAHITDERTGIGYTLCGDYYLPDLVLPEEKAYELGRFGRAKYWHLQNCHRVLLTTLRTSGTLSEYLHSVDVTCEETFSRLVKQYAEREGVTEQMVRATNARTFSGRGFTLFLGLNKSAEELGIKSHNYFIYDTADTVKQYDLMRKVETNHVQATVCLNNAFPECSPPGTCMMYFTTMFMSDDWGNVSETDYFKAKDRVAEDMIRVFERETGCQIRDAIEEIAVASPTTYARYCGHPQGVIYGYETADWDSLMPRMMMMKEDAKLFPGLRFAGGYAMRSSGYSSAYVSGDLSGRQTVGDLKREVR